MDSAGGPERPIRRTSAYSEPPGRPLTSIRTRYEESRARHAEPGWYEWGLREFLRYWYALGVMAVAAFVPLQIEESLVPSNAPPVVDPLIAAAAAVGAGVALLVAGAYGYHLLWRMGGWIDRAVERHPEKARPKTPPRG